MLEAAHSVFLSSSRVGQLLQRGDVARFVFDEDYWQDGQRPVLGLWFEDNPRNSPQAALRLPTWFSNLLPEGPLRQWIAHDRGVSADRELQLLLRIGHDLPGAVTVVEGGDAVVDPELFKAPSTLGTAASESVWKFSLAGVGLKFSLLRRGDRLTLPASENLGNWIVKFPDAIYRDVPANEFATMSIASAVGINVPEIEYVHRDSLPDLPDVMWPGTEEFAYAIKRFDRSESGDRIHIEDMNQVRGFYPDAKYSGTFETVLGLSHRGHDIESLREAVRRLTFNLLVGNGDAHLKNWSFIYPDGRRPKLSPAYDLVSTAGYSAPGHPEDFGLKFGGSKRLERIGRDAFTRIESTLGVERGDVRDVVDSTVERFLKAWADGHDESFPDSARLWITENLQSTTTRLLRKD